MAQPILEETHVPEEGSVSFSDDPSSFITKSVTIKTESLRRRLSAQDSCEESYADLQKVCFHHACRFPNYLEDPLRRSSLVAECIPRNTYLRLAPLLGLDPEVTPLLKGNKCRRRALDEKEEEEVKQLAHLIETEMGFRSDLSEDLQVNPPTYRESVSGDPKPKEKIDNPYLKYMNLISKTTSEESLKQNLGRKSSDLTKQIIQDFLSWYESLGGDGSETMIDQDTLQELFQIGFDMPAAKSLAIAIKEMPTVPESLAALRKEPEQALRAGLHKFIQDDIQAEQTSPRTIAFMKLLPKRRPALRYIPPNNMTKERWLQCARVPEQLETMEAVWGGIENLRSTIAFSDWLQNHPEVTPPPYLEDRGLMNVNYEQLLQHNKEFSGASVEGDAKRRSILNGNLILPPLAGRRSSVESSASAKKYVRLCTKRPS